jgi:hypothetical protein
MVQSGLVRTVQAVLLPPGPTHIDSVVSLGFQSVNHAVAAAGYLVSLPYDYLVKAAGTTNLLRGVTDFIPVPGPLPELESSLHFRVLRLSALSQAYSAVWEALCTDTWGSDTFVAGQGTTRLQHVSPKWATTTPLRTDLDRWLALTEIDAIVALMLGLTEEQLLQMYRSQFAVLRKYEYVTVFDANGRQISGIHHNYGFHQQRWEDALKAAPTRRGERKVGMWARVQAYLAGETDVDLGPFVPPFVPANREKAMSAAYRAFQARLAAS